MLLGRPATPRGMLECELRPGCSPNRPKPAICRVGRCAPGGAAEGLPSKSGGVCLLADKDAGAAVAPMFPMRSLRTRFKDQGRPFETPPVEAALRASTPAPPTPSPRDTS
eukprot:CAMPEP_0179435870 /NCGR_PEP_ID=MMETSP0799-20121207/19908_1 /TAXON_ID=46947 /ORGANISM="Geminigera cryophila, Strain CCMP2564" /LENGTH=109 /DNA_ID=CAMNT_0021215529 /DNA_START=498 /DNA_END=827 /DNA_ORIENTATION=-